MEIHLHDSGGALQVDGSMIKRITASPDLKVAINDAKGDLVASPGNYAFIIDWMKPLAVIKKIVGTEQLTALPHRSRFANMFAHAFADQFSTWESGNDWAARALGKSGYAMAIITSNLGIVAAFEKGPGGNITLIACGDTLPRKKLTPA